MDIDNQTEETEETSLREDLESAVREVAERTETTPNAQQEKPEERDAKSAKARDENGKFAKETADNQDKSQKGKTSPASENAAEIAQVTKPSITAPNTWTPAAKAKWNELPPEIQAEVAKRESEVEKGFTKLDEERNVGKSFKETISPYMPMIQAEGSTPIVAIQTLLNTAYRLRTSSPQEKGQLIMDLARQYGADLSQVSQSQPQTDPQLRAIQQELATLKNARQQELSAREQQEQEATTSLISAFAADPKNVHFETVKADMAALLKAGRARDLQDAYDKAVWASPDIRSTLLEAERQQAEAKRVAEAKDKADKARKASVSISGSPGATAPSKANNEDRSLREELEANFAAARGN